MNNENQAALEQLTRPWSDVLSPKESGTGKYQPIDYLPLLDMLSEAVRSSTGKTQSGRGNDAERSIMNLQAFALREHIDGTVRAWLQDLSKERAPQDLKAALIYLAGMVDALHASNQIDTVRFEHITNQFPRWRASIWEMFEPPVVKELLGKCPACEAAHFYGADGSKSSALIAFYYRGIRPEAKCQRCRETWVGEKPLLELGYYLGATVDEDTLREMGVIA